MFSKCTEVWLEDLSCSTNTDIQNPPSLVLCPTFHVLCPTFLEMTESSRIHDYFIGSLCEAALAQTASSLPQPCSPPPSILGVASSTALPLLHPTGANRGSFSWEMQRV